jgi:CheY-like chemotaxis protein
MRVLVVNDNPGDREFFQRMLRQKGYDTAAAADGLEAIDLADREGPFDLLITDVVLPGMEGVELARRLRATDPDLKILYLTERTDLLFEERSSLWEEEAFLEKPVSVQGLFEAVSLILVGTIPPPRAARVSIPGARARLANGGGDLVSLSLTGALIHAAEDLAVGSTWPIVLELPTDTIRVTGRVVDCRPPAAAAGEQPTARAAVAIAFVGVSTNARRALQRACAAQP